MPTESTCTTFGGPSRWAPGIVDLVGWRGVMGFPIGPELGAGRLWSHEPGSGPPQESPGWSACIWAEEGPDFSDVSAGTRVDGWPHATLVPAWTPC